MNVKARAKDYIFSLMRTGYNSLSIYEGELTGSYVPEKTFFEELEKAFIVGATLKHCVGKSCIDCENYNGVGFYDEWNRPQISCRLGGYHCGVEACDDFRRYDEDDEDWEK